MQIGLVYGGKGAEELSNSVAVYQIEKVLKKYDIITKRIYLNNKNLTINDIQKIDLFFVVDSNSVNPKIKLSIFNFIKQYNIPFVGQGQKTILLARDKYKSNNLFATLHILVPRSIVIDCNKSKSDKSFITSVFKSIKTLNLNYPLVLKDNFGSSSENVFYCRDEKDIALTSITINELCKQMLIEEYIEGREMTIPYVKLFGKIVALNPVEIIYKGAIYNYQIKYKNYRIKSFIPTDLPIKIQKEIKKIVYKTNNAIRSNYYSRLDIKLRNNEIIVIEINGEPTLCINDFVSMSARSMGLSHTKLIIGFLANHQSFINYAEKRNKKLFRLIQNGQKIVNKIT